MLVRVLECAEGKVLEGPTGEIEAILEVTQDMGDILVKSPGEDCDDGHCRIHGDTYNSRDKIKELPYGDGGTQWTGEVWTVAVEKVHELAAVLTIAGWSVTVDAKAVAHCEGFGWLREEVDVDVESEDDEKVNVMYGPHGDENEVSRSWAEDAARVGNFDDVDTFAEKFGLEVVDDEVIKERHGVQDSNGSESSVFSTE